MMQQEFQVEPARGVCAATGKQLSEGETIYTVLFEEGESFRRAEYSEEAWDGPPENAYCAFKTKVPVREKKKRLLVDDHLLVSFFTRLAGETQEARLQFRFVLALILMRKRMLKYEGSGMDGDTEVWSMSLSGDDKLHRVINPGLTDDQIEGVSKQLSAILHGDMGEWAMEDAIDGDTEPAAAPDDQDSTEEADSE